MKMCIVGLTNGKMTSHDCATFSFSVLGFLKRFLGGVVICVIYNALPKKEKF